jgi:hypothetical protein
VTRSGPASVDRRALLREWVWSVTVAECVGFAAPALAGAVSAGWGVVGAVALLVPAGAVAGAALGAAQARLLRRVLPRARAPFDAGRFVVATSAGGAFAYLVAMVPAMLGERLQRIPLPLLVLLGAVLAVLLLASIGFAQWTVLRAAVPRSASWIATTAGAWALGLLLFLAVVTPLRQPGQPVLVVAAIGLLGGLLMAVAVALVTGVAALRLVRRAGGEALGTSG